jgi:hypothetical protein
MFKILHCSTTTQALQAGVQGHSTQLKVLACQIFLASGKYKLWNSSCCRGSMVLQHFVHDFTFLSRACQCLLIPVKVHLKQLIAITHKPQSSLKAWSVTICRVADLQQLFSETSYLATASARGTESCQSSLGNELEQIWCCYMLELGEDLNSSRSVCIHNWISVSWKIKQSLFFSIICHAYLKLVERLSKLRLHHVMWHIFSVMQVKSWSFHIVGDCKT